MEKNKKNLIAWHKGNISWEQAIKLGVSLLVKNEIADNELADFIIASTKKIGPYYIISEFVALAHTTIGKYNKKNGISLIIFENPIKFSDLKKDEVKLLFTLSVTDPKSHMDVLSKFANLIMETDDFVNKITNEKDINRLYEFFNGII